jgi:hypothetical protein
VMKYFIYIIIGIVAAAVVAGFFVVGSPMKERARRFDERRVNDLQSLQSEIVNYWQGKTKLPEKLTDIEDPIRGVSVPKDPENGVDYVYKVNSDLSFSLCAVFSLPNQTPAVPVQTRPIAPTPYYVGDNWNHGAGNVCFERNIDKDLYNPKILK